MAILDNRTSQLNQRFDYPALQATIEQAAISPEEVAFTAEEISLPVPRHAGGETAGAGKNVGESYSVVAEVNSEEAQQELYERLKKEGYTVRLLTL